MSATLQADLAESWQQSAVEPGVACSRVIYQTKLNLLGLDPCGWTWELRLAARSEHNEHNKSKTHILESRRE